MARTVFNNHMVAHVWAQQNPENTEGRSHNGNFSFVGPALFSYSTCIARFVKGKKGRKILLRTSESFSITTTSKHESAVNRAIGFNFPYEIFHVPYIGRWSTDEPTTADHEKNLAYILGKARAQLARVKTIRMNSFDAETYRPTQPDNVTPRFLDTAQEWFTFARTYANAFGLKRTWNADKEMRAARDTWNVRYAAFNHPAAVENRARAQAARDARRRAAEQAEAERRAALIAEAFAEWKAGGRRPSSLNYAVDSAERIELEAAELADWQASNAERIARFEAWQAGTLARPDAWGYVGPYRAAIEADELRERFEREAKQRAAWLAGEHVHWHGQAEDGSALIRVMGDTLETSLGATVPLAHAVKAFRFVKAVRASGQAWTRNGSTVRVGHFQLDRIEPDGSFRAGCHSFAWSEVERVATALGIADLEASSEAVEASR